MKRLLTMILAGMLSLLLSCMISSCAYLPFGGGNDTDANTEQETESQTADSKADSESEESTKAPAKDTDENDQPTQAPDDPSQDDEDDGPTTRLGPGEYGIADGLQS